MRRPRIWLALWTMASICASCGAQQPAYAAAVPAAAREYRGELTRNARAVWGLDAPVATFAAQVHAESGWNPAATSWVGAQGMAQFMPTTAAWIARLYPSLADNVPYNPSWALRALVQYDRYLFERVRARDDCERMAMALSAYNGGLGWITRDQALAASRGLDPMIWWGAVETVNAGRSAANWRENRAYPERIIRRYQPIYAAAQWGPGVCT